MARQRSVEKKRQQTSTSAWKWYNKIRVWVAWAEDNIAVVVSYAKCATSVQHADTRLYVHILFVRTVFVRGKNVFSFNIILYIYRWFIMAGYVLNCFGGNVAPLPILWTNAWILIAATINHCKVYIHNDE